MNSTTVKNADLIRALLDGKTVQYRAGLDWRDFSSPDVAISYLATSSNDFRLKPEPLALVKYLQTYHYEGWGGSKQVVLKTCEAYHLDMRKDMEGKLIRLELDPETLEVLSAKTEQP